VCGTEVTSQGAWRYRSFPFAPRSIYCNIRQYPFRGDLDEMDLVEMDCNMVLTVVCECVVVANGNFGRRYFPLNFSSLAP
jgi:hypothetical protein